MEFGRRMFLLLLAAGASAAGVFRGGTNLHAAEEVVTELNLAYRPDLNIADGTKVMVEGGPWEGRAEEANLFLASGDRVACDVVGLALIKSYGRWKRLLTTSPWEMGQVRRAVELGLGAGSPQELKLVTAFLDGDPAFHARMGKVRSLL